MRLLGQSIAPAARKIKRPGAAWCPLSRFYGIVIALYWNDHEPPHFHAKYSGDEAVIDIKTGKIVKGILSKRARKLVEEWRRQRASALVEDWELAKQRKPLRYIAPLE